MKTQTTIRAVALGVSAAAVFSGPALSQEGSVAGISPVAPPMNFATSEEHYAWLLRNHDGGVQHTWATVPQWEGLWAGSGNTQGANFTDGNFNAENFGIREDAPLTEPYMEAFRMRRENMRVYNEQPYDRLTTCESASFPRWLMEPYVREFVNGPHQSWWLNDLNNDTRRVYINQEHQNIDGTHSAMGDSIGFWTEDDQLIVHTKYLWPADWFRGLPPTSNQMQIVEVWDQITMANGEKRIVVQAHFYDPVSLTRRVDVVYTFRRQQDLEDLGFRIRWWECSINQQTFLTPDGTTQMAIPGEPGWVDIHEGATWFRNPDLPLDLPGQSFNPAADPFMEGTDAGFGQPQ